jgi:transcription elongation GreA/GreB family factor
MVERYYSLERDEGGFLSARLRLVPEKMTEIFEELETLKYEAKHKHTGDKKILRKIGDLEESLAYNFGKKDANFRIQRDDPIIAVN